MRLIFMGTPDFAVPALATLIGSQHQVVAVYTQPPRPAGRGQQVQKPPVMLLAEKHGLEVRTPISLKDPAEQAAFTALNADAAVVAAYGMLLPQPILDAPRFGCVNIHPSLLPRWRGAAPIQRALLAGDAETGVCIMQMDAGLDTGAVLMRGSFAMPPDATTGRLFPVLADMGAKLLMMTLDRIAEGTVIKTPQPAEGVTYAKKLTREDYPLNWHHTARMLDFQVRGLHPSPLATMIFGDTILKIHAARAEHIAHDQPPGTVLDNKLLIACKEGALRILALQKPGGKALAAADFLRGFPIPEGTQLITHH